VKPNSNNSNMKTKRATVQIPINSESNNHYNGQTTPDYEPPSPTTAANGIQAVINPLSLVCSISVLYEPLNSSSIKKMIVILQLIQL